MNQSYGPHRLVIQYMSILEAAPTIVEQVEKRVFGAIDEKIHEWVKSQSDWDGVFDYIEDETYFKPMSWEKDENDNPCASYALFCEDDGEYLHYLSALLSVVPYRFGILFEVKTSWITGRNGRVARPGAAWKRYLAEQFTQTRLAESGFELQGESVFLPIRVDARVLAEAYPDSLDDALVPIDEALRKLGVAHPTIEAFLKAAQKYQFTKSV
ncbi:MAG: hypothetical protein Q8M11_17205 [Sulfuritalea sp.]|nr:hypothetical protein [Sulfuritalea sp.]MDP1984726.1 hypothetical protein [Sulfuritalea sp.]